jgi:hypothetical protein
MPVTDGMIVISLSASLQHDNAARDRVCQITLNRELSRKFEKWRKFSSCIEAKSRGKKMYKMRLPVLDVDFE